MQSAIQKLSILLFSVLLALSEAGPGFAQARSTSKKTGTPQNPQLAFSILPFEDNQLKLPPFFQGHNAVKFVQSLIDQQKKLQKGEFETTASFTARVEAAKKQALVGETTIGDLLAFSFRSDKDEIEFVYNADKGEMNGKVQFGELGEFEDDYGRVVIPALTFFSSEKKVGTFLGRNAFNRATRVTVFQNTYVFIGANSFSASLFPLAQNEKSKIEFSFQIPSEEAKRVKGDLRVLLIGRIFEGTAGPVLTNRTTSKATIDEPYQNENTYALLKLTVSDVWVYEASTGIVRLRLSNAAQDQRVILEREKKKTEEARKATETVAEVSMPPTDSSGNSLVEWKEIRPFLFYRYPAPYPLEARQKEIEGKVTLEFVVDRDGKVIEARALDGPEIFLSTAVQAIKGYRFKPIVINGKTLRVKTTTTLVFSLPYLHLSPKPDPKITKP